MTSQTPTWSNTPIGRAAPGSIIGGRYALRAAIGTGGMGTVWRATDTLLRREVAVKEVVCPPGLAASDRDAMYERTLREARAAAALSHPSVVQVYDVVTEDGRPWIVMELLDARSLADVVIEDGPLAPRAVAKIGIALLGALEVAHAAGVLHRDVKPANVLICADGRCVLTDFGVASMPTDMQLTTPGMVLGSPHFISPERAMGKKFGPPSDLFSLGVSLYTAVEGRPPFDRGDPIETMHAVVEEPPAPAVRAGPLAGILMGLLEKDPARRWTVATARTVLRDLIAGPLTSKAHDHVTDPYAVVPTQRATATPAAVPNGQIGGRAMLPANESLSEVIARAQAGTGGAAAPPAPAPPAPAPPAPAPPAPAHPIAAQTVTGGAGGQHGAGDRTAEWGTHTGELPGHHGEWVQSATAWVTRPEGAGREASQPGTGPARSHRSHRPQRRAAGESMLTTVGRWPPRVQVALAGAAIAVLLLVVLAANGDWFSSAPQTAGAQQPSHSAAPPTDRPLIDVEPLQHGPISVNVPAGWKRTAVNSYVDLVEPAASGRKVRVLIEDTNGTPRRLLEGAERNLSKPSICPAPYQRVELRDTTLAGQDAAELEYTCGEGDQARHGIWRAIVVDGRAYSFYLTVPEPRFAESRAIFDELVRSFKLTA